MALLEVRGLVKKYGRRAVVNGVSFEVNPGEVVGLLGPNGAGKTTSFRMATGQIVPNAGSVLFDNNDVTTLPMFRRARLGMGYLSQEQSIFRKLSVEQNLLAILEALPRSRSLGRRLTGVERRQRTEEALSRFNLLHVRTNNAARCSGGEKRRLEIARCLVCEPMLILLDEPFAAVDPKTTEDIRKNIRDLADQGIGVLLTDHNVREVVKTADRIYLIVEGKVVCHGTPDRLIRDPVAIDAYLGTTFQDDVLMARLAGFAGFGDTQPPPVPLTRPLTDADMPALDLVAQSADVGDDTAVAVPLTPAPTPPPLPARVVEPPRLAPPRVVGVDDRVPARAATPPPAPSTGETSVVESVRANGESVRTPTESVRANGPKFSAPARQLLEDEKMRRMVEQLRDRDTMPDAWHELASRGDAALPVLLEALERRELDVRHMALRLLEAITGETLDYQADGPDEVRLRQAAHLRARLERR